MTWGSGVVRGVRRGRRVAMVLACLCLGHGSAAAGTPPAPPRMTRSPHVRPMTSFLRQTLMVAQERSELLRLLVERIEASDLVVYITEEPFVSSRWIGYLSFVSVAGGHRYVLVHVPSHRPRVDLISALGHELQHAVEIAEAPAVIDDQSLAHHYKQVGYDATSTRSGRRFESRAAIDAGHRVRADVLTWKRIMPRDGREEGVVLE